MSESPFHPDLRDVADAFPPVRVGRARLRLGRLKERVRPPRRPPEGVRVERVGAVSVRLHGRRSDAPGPAVLWIHGGGYIGGRAADDDGWCAHVAATLGVLVAAVDYRRAPEHPYPIPLDDCYGALVWLADRPDVDPALVAVAGASAGGGLAAGVALLARDRGAPRPAFQLLSYPALDDRTALRADVDDRNRRVWDNRANRFAWRCYLGMEPGADGVSEFAAPGRQGDLSGLPPAWLGVGTADLFHDEVVTYGQRLRDAGVRCELCVVAGAFHGFDAVCPDAPVSRRYRAAQLDALGRALDLTPSSENR